MKAYRDKRTSTTSITCIYRFRAATISRLTDCSIGIQSVQNDFSSLTKKLKWKQLFFVCLFLSVTDARWLRILNSNCDTLSVFNKTTVMAQTQLLFLIGTFCKSRSPEEEKKGKILFVKRFCWPHSQTVPTLIIQHILDVMSCFCFVFLYSKAFRLPTWQRDGVYLPASLQTAAMSAPTYPWAASASCVSSSVVALHGTKLNCFCKMSARSAAPGTPTWNNRKFLWNSKVHVAEPYKEPCGTPNHKRIQVGLHGCFQWCDHFYHYHKCNVNYFYQTDSQ